VIDGCALPGDASLSRDLGVERLSAGELDAGEQVSDAEYRHALRYRGFGCRQLPQRCLLLANAIVVCVCATRNIEAPVVPNKRLGAWIVSLIRDSRMVAT